MTTNKCTQSNHRWHVYMLDLYGKKPVEMHDVLGATPLAAFSTVGNASGIYQQDCLAAYADSEVCDCVAVLVLADLHERTNEEVHQYAEFISEKHPEMWRAMRRGVFKWDEEDSVWRLADKVRSVSVKQAKAQAAKDEPFPDTAEGRKAAVAALVSALADKFSEHLLKKDDDSVDPPPHNRFIPPSPN